MSLTKVTYSMVKGAPVNVLDFGAVGDGITDDTAAIQAAINYVESFTWVANQEGRPQLHFPAGRYLTEGLVFNKVMDITGDGMAATYIKLKAGQTVPLFTLNAEDILGTPLENARPYGISDMVLEGNRIDITTQNNSHGIYCPDTPWSTSTQYSSSINATNIDILGFTGDGIHLGTNRNWALMYHCVSRYCNKNGLTTYGYDHRITSCDFGNNEGSALSVVAGGGCSYVGCNFFYSKTFNINIAQYANNWNSFVNCDIAAAYTAAVNINNATSSVKFIGCQFSGNSSSSSGSYSDIVVDGAATALSVVGCSFNKFSTTVNYLVATLNNAKVIWQSNNYDVTTDIPYSLGVTNVPSRLIYAGDKNFNIFYGGKIVSDSAFGGFSGPVLTAVYTKATAPSPTNMFGGIIYVENATGGATLAFSNGVDWISVLTGSAI